MYQYTRSEIEALLNEKRDIEEKSAALKAEIAEVEAATIKVDSNEEIINNRVEGIKFDIAKGKETYSDLEDRLAELEDKRKRAEEQQQIFQLFEEFDDSFTIPTVVNTPVVINNSASLIQKFDSPVHYFCHYADLEVEDYPAEGEYLTDEQFNTAFTNWTTSRDICMRPEVPLAELNDKEIMALFSWQNNNLLEVAYNLHENIYTKEQYFILSEETLIRLNLIEEEAGDIDAIRKHLINSPVALVGVDTAEVNSKDSADLSKDNTDSLEDNSSSDGEALHYTPLETPYTLDQKVVEIVGDEEDNEIYYETNPEDEVILDSQIENAERDNLIDSVEEGENIEEVISNAESKVSIPTYIEEELEVMATTPNQLTPEQEVEFYTQGNISSALVLVTQESPKKVEPISVDDTTLLKEYGHSPNNVIAFKDNLYDKSQELEWYKGTLKEAMDASDSCFDKDCLNYIRYFVKGVKSTKVYTFENHNNLIKALHSKGVSNIVQFIEHGLLQYFQLGYTQQPFSEEEYNHISMYLIEKRYTKFN